MIVRLATPDDEPFLAGFIDFGDIEVEWAGAHESWLVAEEDDELLGAIQVTPSKPIGHIEFLTVKKSLASRKRFEISMSLSEGARLCLVANGTPNARVMVEFENTMMKKLLKKYFNGSVVNQGNLVWVRA